MALAPTRFLPLSLHDALPISEVHVLVAVRRFLRHDYVAGLEESASRLPALREVAWLTPAAESGADRKSTRLNSSHRTISHAGFSHEQKKSGYRPLYRRWLRFD